ncbi:MAG: thioredoxin family protein, partial [Lentisphaeria bacterium]|nr:thioredoxin family protein [Lentisphaeria bacterium]
MKNKFFTSFLALLSLVNVFAVDTSNWVKGPDKSWMLTVEDALVKAKKTKKKVYVLKTGSDWCGFCIRLRKDVLENKSFKTYARKNL